MEGTSDHVQIPASHCSEALVLSVLEFWALFIFLMTDPAFDFNESKLDFYRLQPKGS